MTSKQLKSLTSASRHNDPSRTEQIFYDINHTIAIVNFDQSMKNNKSYKSGLFISIMNTIIPLLTHENLKIRMQVGSFLAHWCSLISAFSPESLLKGYQFFDSVSTLQPAAQSVIFNFFTNSISSIPPSQRLTYIGTCHCILMASQPEMLTKVTQDVWGILRSELTVSNIASIVKFLINSSIPKVVSFLCMKDPDSLFPIVSESSNLQFLKEFIPFWPDNILFKIDKIKDKICEAVKSSNSNDISAAIEIVILIADKMFIPPLIPQFRHWKEILNCMVDLWTSSNCNVSHKAALIDLFSALTKFEMIPVKYLRRFIVFKYLEKTNDPNSPILNLPTTIQVSIIKLSSVFVKNGKLPIGLTEFLKKQAIFRDPLLYVAVLHFLQKCFNEFFSMAPSNVTEILDLCLHPLPRYFVEQLQIIELFNIIDWNVFNLEMIHMNIIDVVLDFLKEPHPSVVEKLSFLIQKMNIELPYAKLDWFEDASYFLTIFHKLDPSFIIELLDETLLPSASYAIATDALVDAFLKTFEQSQKLTEIEINSDDESKELDDETNLKEIEDIKKKVDYFTEIAPIIFSRVIPIITDGVKALGYEIDASIKSLYNLSTKNWMPYSEKMPQLLEIINQDFRESTFGLMIKNSLKLMVLTVKYVDKLTETNAVGLVNIAKLFGCCFTRTTCELLLAIKDIIFNENIQNAMLLYYDRNLPFTESDIISVTAVQTVTWPHLLKNLREYLEVAADKNGEILVILDYILTIEDEAEDEMAAAIQTSSSSSITPSILAGINANKNKAKITPSSSNTNSDSTPKADLKEEDINDNNEFLVKPYRSFLALKYRPEYVQNCMKIFPFNEWVITPDDFDFIGQQTEIKIHLEKLDPIHKEVVSQFPKSFITMRNQRKYSRVGEFRFKMSSKITLFQDSTSQIKETKSREEEEEEEEENNDDQNKMFFEKIEKTSEIKIKPPKIPKGINPYKGLNLNKLENEDKEKVVDDDDNDDECCSNFELFVFLWFSNRDVSDEQWKDIEKYAMEVHEDSRFVASFFSYAWRKNLPIDMERWPSLINVDYKSHFSFLSVSFYLSFFKDKHPSSNDGQIKDEDKGKEEHSEDIKYNDLPKEVIDLIERSAIALGIQTASEFNLIEAFKSETGIRKLVVESIMRIDQSRFAEMLPYTTLKTIDDVLNAMKDERLQCFLPDMFNVLIKLLPIQNIPTSLYSETEFKLPCRPVDFGNGFVINFDESNTKITDESNSEKNSKEEISSNNYENKPIIPNDSFGELLDKYTNSEISIMRKRENNKRLHLDILVTDAISNFIIGIQQQNLPNSITLTASQRNIISSFIFYLLNKIHFTREQFLRIIQLIPTSHPLYSYFLTAKVTPEEQAYLLNSSNVALSTEKILNETNNSYSYLNSNMTLKLSSPTNSSSNALNSSGNKMSLNSNLAKVVQQANITLNLNNAGNFTQDRFDRLISFLQNKPPSYSRELIKILILSISKSYSKSEDSKIESVSNCSSNHDIIVSSKSEYTKIIKNITPVFFELLIQGFDNFLPNTSSNNNKLNLSIYDKRFKFAQESILSFTEIDNDSLKFMKNVAMNSSHSVYIITRRLFEVIDRKLKSKSPNETKSKKDKDDEASYKFCKIFNALNDDLAIIELCDQIASILVSTPNENSHRHYLFDSIFTVEIFLKRLSPDQLIATFFSNDFLNSHAKTNVFVCTKMIMNAMKNSSDERIKANLSIISAIIKNRNNDPRFIELYESDDDIKSLSTLFLTNGLSD